MNEDHRLYYDGPLYKFRSVRSPGIRELLVENRIWLSKSSELNDPFECSPIVVMPRSRQRRGKYARHLVERHMGSVGREERARQRRRIKAQMSSPHANLLNMREVADTFGFYSLSATADNLLLWSHYGDAHRGFAVEFAQSIENRFFATALPVTYSRERPQFAVDDSTKDSQDIVQKGILTKSVDWEYEQEYRLVRQNEFGYVDLPPSELTGIVFGCRMAECDRATILEMVSGREQRPKLYEARMSADRFALDIEDIAG